MREGRNELTARRVVLTGATGGLGRAIAERLARDGAELLLIGRRADELRELGEGLGASVLVGDLTDGGFVASLPSRVSDVWGAAPDVLINNAGAFELAPLHETDVTTFERLLAVNLCVPFELTRLWLPAMIERRAGQVVNIGSIAGRVAFAGNAAYSASKYGLRGLHEVLVEELQGTGVRATWIEPSAVNTPLWDRFDPDRRSDLPGRAAMLVPEAVAGAVFYAIAQPESVAVQEIVIRANPQSSV